MGGCGRGGRWGAIVVVAAFVAALTGCASGVRVPPAGAPPADRGAITGPSRPAGGAVPTPRDFQAWRQANADALAAFQAHLQLHGVDEVVPLLHLVRTASSWRICGVEPFDLPPPAHWPQVVSVLQLLRQLRELDVLGPFEVQSAFRNPALNRCAGGAANSAHVLAFAVDLKLLDEPRDRLPTLCRFWREQGSGWRMGLGQYPTGRVHIDTFGHRVWGADQTGRSSPCAVAAG